MLPHEKPFGRRYFEWLANNHLLLLMAIATILIVTGLGFRAPWPADEPRFALIAKEMVETGRWFFPARAGEFYPDKPPVFMWSIAIFYSMLGSLNVAFLLSSALCALLTVFVIFDIGKRLWSTQTGFIAGLLLVFSLQFMLQAKTAQIDAMVCCWITLGCYGLLRFTLVDGKWRWYYFAWFFMGIGVITKGVGFLPLLMLLPYAYYRKSQDVRNTIVPIGGNHLRWALGPVIMLSVIGLWLFPMLWLVEVSNNPYLEQYRDNILFKQTLIRYADAWHHLKPFYYYFISVIPVFWLPLSLAIPWLIPKWRDAIIKERDGRILLPFAWIILVLLFFSLSPGKRGVYILPALPMLALISAPYIQQLLKYRSINWLVFGAVVLLSAGILIVGLSGILGLHFAAALEEKFDISPWWLFITLGAGGVISIILNMHSNQWRSWPVFISILWLLYSTWGYNLFEEVRTPKKIYQTMMKHIPTNAELGLVNFSEQFILFSPFSTTHFGYHTKIKEQIHAAFFWQGKAENRYILLDYALVEMDSDCFDKEKAIHLGSAHRSNWVLLGQSARKTECLKPHQNLNTFHHYQALANSAFNSQP